MTKLSDLKVGDVVSIYVEVTELPFARPEFQVELFSKTDQYRAWVHEQHLDPEWLTKQKTQYLQDHFTELKYLILNDTTLPEADREAASRRLDVILSDLVK